MDVRISTTPVNTPQRHTHRHIEVILLSSTYLQKACLAFALCQLPAALIYFSQWESPCFLPRDQTTTGESIASQGEGQIPFP
jgi:hypothetical protein